MREGTTPISRLASELTVSTEDVVAALEKIGVHLPSDAVEIPAAIVPRLRETLRRQQEQPRRTSPRSTLERALSALNGSLVLLDTSFLMHPMAEVALTAPEVQSQLSAPIYVPASVIKELLVQFETHESQSVRSLAERGLQFVQKWREQGKIKIKGSNEDDTFADNVFLTQISRLSREKPVVLITQDRELARDVLNLGKQKSVRRRRIVVLRTSEAGRLGPNDPDFLVPDWGKQPTRRDQQLRRNGGQVQAFPQAIEPTAEREETLEFGAVPTTGATLSCSRGEFVLGRNIASGGEGSVYETTLEGMLCKIYHADRLTNHRLEKLRLMVEVDSPDASLAWPAEFATDSEGRPRGIIMRGVQGTSLAREVFIPAVLKKHKDWTRIVLVRIARQIAQQVALIHDLGVVIGDLNPHNFLVTNAGDVSMVDLDTVQVGPYPCTVSMVNFTAPELQGKDLSGLLRTQEHDLFALATMIFMVLVPGKPPYSQQGGGDPAENINLGKFPYRFGPDNAGKKAPKGAWRLIWSNLPYKTRKALFDCFTGRRRRSAHDWVWILTAYEDSIKLGHVTDEIFPKNFKPVTQYAADNYGLEPKDVVLTQATCSECGELFVTESLPGQMVAAEPDPRCPRCMGSETDEMQVECDFCGVEFRVREEKADLHRVNSKWFCTDCSASHATALKCKDCGEEFLLPLREQAFYESHDLEQPRRCATCRQRRKKEQEQERKSP